MDSKNYMAIKVGSLDVKGELAGYLSSVTLKDSVEALDSATIVFQIPEGISYKPAELDLYGKTWSIDVFEGGIPVKSYGGDIIGISWQRSGSAPRTMTLTCIDHLHRLRKARASSKAGDRRFKDKATGADIVKLVANDWKLTPGDIQSPPGGYSPPLEWKSDDLSLLKKLADDAGYVVRVDSKSGSHKLQFTKREAASQLPPVNLIFGVDVLDITGNHSLAEALSKVTLTSKNQVKATEPVKGVADPAKVTPDNAATHVAAKLVDERLGGAPFEQEFKGDEGGKVEQSTVQAAAEAKIKEASAKFVDGSMTCVFKPSIVSGRKVKVKGAGWPLDGTFIVKEVTHTFDPGGYRTTITFSANSIAAPS